MNERVNLNHQRVKVSSGFTMLELLFVTVAAALLFLASFGLYKLAYNNAVVTNTIRLITTIKSQSQISYANSGDYGVASLIPTLRAKQAFPADVLNAAGNPVDPWRNVIAIQGNNQVFNIGFTSVPTQFCMRLGPAFTQADTDFSSLSVGSGPVIFNDTNPITIAGLEAACTSAANAQMIWSFF